jgi:glucose/mannose transport system substrate-binding protein
MFKCTRYAPALVVLSVALIFSACSGGGNKVEVFPFWTGNDTKSFDALVTAFKEKHPTIQFVNATTAIGPGVDTHFVLETLLQAGEPPDSWQGYAGQALNDDYAASREIQPLNDLYESEGWTKVMPEKVIPLISKDGNIYSVPVDVHRTNVLWYNPAVLDANGIAVPTNMNDWFLAMDAISAAGVTPLAIGNQETKLLLFETILLSSLGPKKYNGLWNGSGKWGGDDVKAALGNYQKVLSYANSDSDALSWQDATELVANGTAAFIVMGDWANGYFRERGKALTADYNVTSVPGTQGIFQFYSDSFVLAENALNEEGGLAWLKFVGSKEGQETFNSSAGSICVRTDCDTSLFDEYARSSMAHWSSDVLVGSLTYGVVANNSWRSEIDAALTIFLQDGDVDAFQSALVAACKNSGPCQ